VFPCLPGDAATVRGDKKVDETDFRYQYFPGDEEGLHALILTPAMEGSITVASDLRCILNCENIVILSQLIYDVLSESASFFVGHAEQFSAIGNAGVVMTGPFLVPEIGGAIVFRVNFSVNEVEDYIVNPNCVTAGFLAGVLAGDFSAAQKVESGRFADVSYTVKLIL
jgi:hypothetical protein